MRERDHNRNRECWLPWLVACQVQCKHRTNFWIHWVLSHFQMWSARLKLHLLFLCRGCLYLEFHAVQHDPIAVWSHKMHVNTRFKHGLRSFWEWVNSSCTGVGSVLPLEGAVADCTLRSRLFLWIEQKGREGRGLIYIHFSTQINTLVWNLPHLLITQHLKEQSLLVVLCGQIISEEL